MIREHGWECPKCQRIWAPKIAACGYCNTMLSTAPYIGTPRWPTSGDVRWVAQGIGVSAVQR